MTIRTCRTKRRVFWISLEAIQHWCNQTCCI